MAGFTDFLVFLILFTLSNKISQIESAKLEVMSTPENMRSKHMVKYHHTIRGEYPYSLSLQLQRSNTNNTTVHVCGATLILVQDVILAVTSASCLEDYDRYGNSSFSLVAGVVQSNRTEYMQRRSVCGRVVHEEYLNSSMFPSYPRPNDIALLFIKSEQPFETDFKINVYPIELPTSREQRLEEPLIAVGWEVGKEGYFISHVFETPTLSNQECTAEFLVQKREACTMGLGLDHLCGANEEPFEGGTQSRGSPILSATTRYLAAIWNQSYSKGSKYCGSHPSPEVFTSIPYHRDWINKQVGLYKTMSKNGEKNLKSLCN